MGLAALFLWLAPEGLALGAGAYLYSAATRVGFGAAQGLDVVAQGSAEQALQTHSRAQHTPSDGELERREIDLSDDPACRRCEGETRRHEQHKRFRCLKCNLSQPQVNQQS